MVQCFAIIHYIMDVNDLFADEFNAHYKVLQIEGQTEPPYTSMYGQRMCIFRNVPPDGEYLYHI